MTQGTQSSNRFIKILGGTVIGTMIAVLALLWAFYSTYTEGAAMATQIAKQDVQIALGEERNRLLSEQSTASALKANIDDQLRTPLPTNNSESAATATALGMQSLIIESTRRAIEDEQKQLEATQEAFFDDPDVEPPALQSFIPLTRQQAAQKWGGRPEWWSSIEGSGWKINGTLTLSVGEDWRVDYTDQDGTIHSCGDVHEPGKYGPVTVDVTVATLWHVPGETGCLGWTTWAKSR